MQILVFLCSTILTAFALLVFFGTISVVDIGNFVAVDAVTLDFFDQGLVVDQSVDFIGIQDKIGYGGDLYRLPLVVGDDAVLEEVDLGEIRSYYLGVGK